MDTRNSLPRHILVAAQEGLSARLARVDAEITLLRAAVQAAPARRLLTREQREQQAEKMRRWWRRKKRRQAQRARQVRG